MLYSGYTRDTSFLEMVVDIVQELKTANPNLVYGKYSAQTPCFLLDFSVGSFGSEVDHGH